MIGSGFFQHSDWFVSNAHVLPNYDVLLGTELISRDKSVHTLTTKEAFHRPYQKNNCPDLVIVHTGEGSRAAQNHASLPTRFTDDEHHNETCFFYVDLADEIEPIKLLTPIQYAHALPLMFIQQGETPPMPGSSGSPIIEARVAEDHEPVWQFRVVGALYARCSADWVNQQQPAQLVPSNTQCVCAIPAQPDFLQILNRLRAQSRATRHGQMAAGARALGDEKGLADAKYHDQQAIDHQQQAENLFQEFEEGKTHLSIQLPEGLERLWVHWQDCARVGLRMNHPNNQIYNVPGTHSNHHIIPIDDLLYIWDYFHYLPSNKLIEVKETVKKKIQELQQEKINKLNDEIDNFYRYERNKKWPEGIKRIREEVDQFKSKALKETADNTLKQLYGEFHKLIAILCEPNNVDRTCFAWAYWNLFKGWNRVYRKDDPSDDEKQHDFSEKIKPQGFNNRQWQLIKGKNGLYDAIQQIKRLKAPDQKSENQLLTAVSNLAEFWKTIKDKKIYAYNSDDWHGDSKQKKYGLNPRITAGPSLYNKKGGNGASSSNSSSAIHYSNS